MYAVHTTYINVKDINVLCIRSGNSSIPLIAYSKDKILQKKLNAAIVFEEKYNV